MSETSAIGDLVIKADKNTPASHMTLDDGREFVIHRNDFKLEQITAPNAAEVHKPKLVIQGVQIQTVSSAIDYIDRFKNSDSVIFADMASSTVLAVIDYHKEADEVGAVAAELTRHTATLRIPHSLEWNTWIGMSGKLMGHKDFATFLEENQIDILPFERMLAETEEESEVPQSLLEMTRQLQVTRGVKFDTSVRHGNYDRVEFVKTEDATVRGGVSMPLSFTINIPVYFGEAPVLLTCMIRKKVSDDGLQLGFAVLRAENMRQMEFQRIVSVIAGSTELTTLFGKPA